MTDLSLEGVFPLGVQYRGENGTKFNEEIINNLLISDLFKINTEDKNKNDVMFQLKDQYNKVSYM